MKAFLLFIMFFCTIQFFHAQEDDGVVALTIPVRNSLTFNRFALNPTFTFVREQHKYIALYNKREWTQFEDAPVTYMAGYTGRFAENIGAGLSLFQQNYGVLTTFGGVANFAYNIRVNRDNNFTFGLNVGAYQSGVNTGNVVSNVDDPALQNVPSNFLLSVSPGINFGTAFFDFGLSVNNLVQYNVSTSEMLEDNPEQGLQGHIMYTGYMTSRGFFDNTKFTGLIRTELRMDETIISANAMLTNPKGIWMQVGYNSVFGASAGIGLNITSQIALEYNYEMAVGDLAEFGSSHDFSLAYRFKNNKRYDYGNDDEVAGLVSTKKRKPVVTNRSKAEENRKLAEQKAKERAEEQARLAAEQKAKEEAEAQARLAAEQKAKEEAEAQARLAAEQKAKEEAEEQARLAAEQKAKEEAEAQARLAAEQKAKKEAEAQAKLAAEQKAKEEAEAQARLAAEQKAKEEAEAQARLAAEQKAKEEAEEQARLLAEQKAKEAAEAEALLLAAQEAKENQDSLIMNPKDDLGKAMQELTQETDASGTIQNELLGQYDEMVDVKDQDLKSMREENDLSEQGIAVQPRPFKSITAENAALNKIKTDLDKIIASRNKKIEELKELYDDMYEADTIYNEEVFLFYRKTIDRLETEQRDAIEARGELEIRLEQISVATEIERKRRIKRAAFDNEDERYTQDRAALQNIKENTTITNSLMKESDFDFGEIQEGQIQILKNVNRTENGYYLILAVHTDVNKRNDFLRKVVATGNTDVDFFYDVNSSKYYIYQKRFDSIDAANRAMENKGSTTYNTKMSLIKIEN